MSQPIEHSPGPWHKDLVTGTAVIYDNSGEDVAKFASGGQPIGVDMSLMLAAPTMYQILWRICCEDWEERIEGLRCAQCLIQELEGGQ